MPWIVIRQGRAREGLDLNYFTPSSPVTLWRSVRSRHFLVSSAMAGSALLRLMAVASTSVLAIEDRAVPRTRWISVQGHSSPWEGPVCREQATPDSGMVSADGATVAWGNQQHNIPYPPHTTPRFLIQGVDYLKADLLPGSSVEADLAVLLPIWLTASHCSSSTSHRCHSTRLRR